MQKTIVIGGGVVGLGVAWELARRGQAVIVLERNRIGAGASDAAAGMLCPMAELDFVEDELLLLKRDSLERYPAFVEALETASEIDVGLKLTGTLSVALDRDDAAALRRHYEHRRTLDLPVAWLTGAEVRRRQPGLSPRVQAGIHVPVEGQVDNRRLVQALGVAARRAGVTIREGAEVLEVAGPGRVQLAGEVLTADHVVVAAGAWSRQLGPTRQTPVRPVRGEMLAVQMDPVDALGCVVRAPDCYLVPRADGRLIIGATSEEVGFDDRVTAGGLFELLRGASETLPGVREWEVLETWAGLRPGTLDNDPILGHTEVPGLTLATGHYRNGILLLPATAHYVAEAVVTGATPEAIAPFGPGRFAPR